MPALGMAQETGLIVSWLKAPGDAVAKGEALLEVETDKATMEVEAAADGFLSDVRAGAGDDVPVGQVIALIAETADAVVEGGGSADKAAAEEIPAAEAAAPAPLPPEVPVAPTHVAPVVAGRVLASPKARRLAAEQGLDLAALAGAGHPQPFHVRDLDAARAPDVAILAACGGAARPPPLAAAASGMGRRGCLRRRVAVAGHRGRRRQPFPHRRQRLRARCQDQRRQRGRRGAGRGPRRDCRPRRRQTRGRRSRRLKTSRKPRRRLSRFNKKIDMIQAFLKSWTGRVAMCRPFFLSQSLSGTHVAGPRPVATSITGRMAGFYVALPATGRWRSLCL